LVVTDVRVLDVDEPDEAVSHVELGQPFVVELEFRLEDPGSGEVESEAPALDVEVYADPITPGPTSLITGRRLTISGREKNTARLLVSGLPEGIYRLVTTVMGSEMVPVSGYHDGPVVSVS
jgi:hypothetical protein